MASRTQIRLEQLTGSAVDLKSEAVQYALPRTAAALTGSDVRDLFGMIGAALNRIHGAGSSEPFNSAAGVFNQNIQITGTTPKITIGDAGEEDTILAFDGNAQDYYVGLDDTDDKLHIGRGQVPGTTPAITIDTSGDVTIAGSLDVNGTTTTIDTVNLSVQDSIIALGVSGSDGTFNNVGDRGILFARATSVEHALPGLWYDGSNSDFNFADTNTGPASGSFGTVSAYRNLNAGNLGVYSAASLKGTLEVSSNDIVLSSSAGNDIILDSNSGKIQLEKDGSNVGFLQASPGPSGNGLILSASAQETLILDANTGIIQFGREALAAGGGIKVATVIQGDENTEKFSFVKSDDENDINFTLKVETHIGGTFANQFVGVSGSLRLFEESHGQAYVGLRSQANTATSYNIQFPNAIGSANQVMTINSISGDNALLNFTDISDLTAPSKGIHIVTGSHAAGVNLPTNVDMIGDNIDGLTLTEAQGKTLDVYVNGQLLLSGNFDSGNVQAGRDYSINADSIKFAFDLEIDDVVQVIKR